MKCSLGISNFLKEISSHLEPDILECEVKWTLGSITIVEVMEFQLSYFKS